MPLIPLSDDFEIAALLAELKINAIWLDYWEKELNQWQALVMRIADAVG